MRPEVIFRLTKASEGVESLKPITMRCVPRIGEYVNVVGVAEQDLPPSASPMVVEMSGFVRGVTNHIVANVRGQRKPRSHNVTVWLGRQLIT